MSMNIGGATVALVESRHGGMYCEAHPSRLALVLALIDNGAIGLADSFHGSDAHVAALDAIEAKLESVRAKIRADREHEARIAAMPAHPPCLQCGAMTADEAETKCLGAAVDDCHGNALWPEA